MSRCRCTTVIMDIPLQRFTVDVTEEFLEWVESGSLPVEVWGHQHGGFTTEVTEDEERKPKTFVER